MDQATDQLSGKPDSAFVGTVYDHWHEHGARSILCSVGMSNEQIRRTEPAEQSLDLVSG
jgi:hypothetical protein